VVMKCSIFWDITPCSPLKVNRRFGGTCRLHLQGRALLATCFALVSCFYYSSTLKMNTRSSETSVDFQRTTRRYIPEDRTHHNHHRENLKSYSIFIEGQPTFRSNISPSSVSKSNLCLLHASCCFLAWLTLRP
jgi:hypothetical protein